MRKFLAFGAALLTCLSTTSAWGWGASGHSVVAEIAQRRLTPRAAREVEELLGRGHSLASVASWADYVREARPYSALWHYVDIPVAIDSYDPARDCKLEPGGDCVIAELTRLDHDLRCAETPALRAEALRFAVHFVGDLHQPLHTLLEARGGNDVRVSVDIRGNTCRNCTTPTPSNLHSVWDTLLIERTVWDWGAYVDRLEGGLLRTDEITARPVGGPVDWAVDAHTQSQRIWAMTPADAVLNDDYWRAAQPIIDRQLSLGGVHLAAYLNTAFSRRCEDHGVWYYLSRPFRD